MLRAPCPRLRGRRNTRRVITCEERFPPVAAPRCEHCGARWMRCQLVQQFDGDERHVTSDSNGAPRAGAGEQRGEPAEQSYAWGIVRKLFDLDSGVGVMSPHEYAHPP